MFVLKLFIKISFLKYFNWVLRIWELINEFFGCLNLLNIMSLRVYLVCKGWCIIFGMSQFHLHLIIFNTNTHCSSSSISVGILCIFLVLFGFYYNKIQLFLFPLSIFFWSLSIIFWLRSPRLVTLDFFPLWLYLLLI